MLQLQAITRQVISVALYIHIESTGTLKKYSRMAAERKAKILDQLLSGLSRNICIKSWTNEKEVCQGHLDL